MKGYYSKLITIVPLILSASALFAQSKNIEVKQLYTDSLSSSFEISVRDSVRLHYHAKHTEHLFVLEGEARMQIGENTFTITQGNYYTIPKGARHAVWVLSELPLKVISVQSPQFLGEDRHFLE